jgi:hypothetical protein
MGTPSENGPCTPKRLKGTVVTVETATQVDFRNGRGFLRPALCTARLLIAVYEQSNADMPRGRPGASQPRNQYSQQQNRYAFLTRDDLEHHC